MLKEKRYTFINLLVAILFLQIYGLTLVSNVLYYHSHVTNGGKVISHAHPFNKQNDNDPYKTHNHSKFELLLLFSDNYSPNDIQTEIKSPLPLAFDHNMACRNVPVMSKVFSSNSGRAPPCV